MAFLQCFSMLLSLPGSWLVSHDWGGASIASEPMMLPHSTESAKWVISEEASWEVEALQDYVVALARHDLLHETPVDTPVHFAAALGIPLESDSAPNVSSLTVGHIMDMHAFWSPVQHHYVAQVPLHWGNYRVTSGLEWSGKANGAPLVNARALDQIPVAPPTLFLSSGLPGGSPKQEPAAGWCATAHRPRKAAQSGYRGDDGKSYCKVCFRAMFPELFAEKQSARKKACRICSSNRELVRGVCKPCGLVCASVRLSEWMSLGVGHAPRRGVQGSACTGAGLHAVLASECMFSATLGTGSFEDSRSSGAYV